MEEPLMKNGNILITGANRGLGLALVREGLQQGYQVFAACRNPIAARQLQELKERHDNDLNIVAMDVTDEASIIKAKKHIEKETTSISMIFNNAGINTSSGFDASATFGPLAKIETAAIERLINVNALGPLSVSKIFYPLLLPENLRVIVFISSDRGSLGLKTVGSIGYAVSKAALNMVVKKLSQELFENGIQSFAVHPGWVRTDMGGNQATLDPAASANAIFQLAINYRGAPGRFVNFDGSPLPW